MNNDAKSNPPGPAPASSQLDQARALLRPLRGAVFACDLAALKDVLGRTQSIARRPDASIDRETWARLRQVSELTEALRAVLNQFPGLD